MHDSHMRAECCSAALATSSGVLLQSLRMIVGVNGSSRHLVVGGVEAGLVFPVAALALTWADDLLEAGSVDGQSVGADWRRPLVVDAEGFSRRCRESQRQYRQYDELA